MRVASRGRGSRPTSSSRLERAFVSGDKGPLKARPTRHAAGGIAILVMLAVAIITVIVLVKLVFF